MQLYEEGAEEMSVEDIMEEHCEELRDKEIDSDGGEFSDMQAHGDDGGGSTNIKKTAAKTKSQTKRKLKSIDSIPLEKTSSLGDETWEDNKEWSPQSVMTDWGRTDDVVTIGNGERYYFFKIPHKVRSRGHKKVNTSCLVYQLHLQSTFV